MAAIVRFAQMTLVTSIYSEKESRSTFHSSAYSACPRLPCLLAYLLPLYKLFERRYTRDLYPHPAKHDSGMDNTRAHDQTSPGMTSNQGRLSSKEEPKG
jgi:hypothetical protein